MAAALLVAGGQAGAAFVNAQLWIRGHGSKFTSSSGSSVATAVGAVGTPGHSVSYDAEVVNTGTATAQFLVFGSTTPGSTVAFAAGHTDITAAVTSGSGYTTPMIAAGDFLALTMTVTLDAGAAQGTFAESDMSLQNIGGSISDQVVAAFTSVQAVGHGTGASDAYISSPGGGHSSVGPFGTQVAAGLPLRAGSSETFTVKLENDGTGSVPVTVRATDLPSGNCNGSFALTVKQGSHDVTAQALGSGYTTPALAHGKSQVLKFTFRYPVAVSGCFEENYRLSVSPGNATPGSLINVALPTSID
jgi:hypothetical protein